MSKKYEYDFLLVGAGLFNAIFAREAAKQGKNRSLRFENELLDIKNYQGNAVINYTEREIPFTRIIEHKHFEFGQQAKTVITREYSQAWNGNLEPYYPVNTPKNEQFYQRYMKISNYTQTNKNSSGLLQASPSQRRCIVFVIFAKAKPEAIQKFIGERYKELAQKENKVFFGGRLGEYKYLDMDKVIESAVSLYRKMNDADALRYK